TGGCYRPGVDTHSLPPEAAARTPSRSLGHCAIVSGAAALLGSLVAAIVAVPFQWGLPTRIEDAGSVLVAVAFAALEGAIVALPASLVVGPALLWPTQRLVVRFPLFASVTFALIGLVLARELMLWLNRDSIRKTCWAPRWRLAAP
ncbi:MAG TPA: hypothetical protein VI168_16840, partial [Croceibacterium sp.]